MLLERVEGAISYFKKYIDEGFSRSMRSQKKLQKRWMYSECFVKTINAKERNILMSKMIEMRKKH